MGSIVRIHTHRERPVKTRRRYAFPDRASAEAAVERERRLGLFHSLTMQAMWTGEIQWVKGPTYDAAVIEPNRCDGGCVVVCFHAEGQRPSFTYYSPYEVRDWRKTMWDVKKGDTERAELRELLDKILPQLPY